MIHGSDSTPTIAFTTEHSQSRSSFRCRGRSSRGGGRGYGRRIPHCQLCRIDGHYASYCPNLASYATKAVSSDANLAHAFHAQCHVTDATPDWYVADSGASTYMKASPNNLSNASPYKGQENVIGTGSGQM